ncbi:hypothetical protein OPV22_001511 [Ensete ventricosum]|uniref:Uncharacterized protein n=1 Tax=Ensete ventricosum TaxID=4639 RepID=A0AAV8RQB9_ENSVE|nr:hypothetical protein OPV22_001511 [Ensete ventricosum]
MGLLDQLWDDTIAGPRPETGLGRLRKQSSSGLCSNSSKEGAAKDAATGRSEGTGEEVAVTVTRSIMIKRPAGYSSPANATPPASPAGSTPPISPFSGGEWSRFRRKLKSSSDAYGRMGGGMAGVGSQDST